MSTKWVITYEVLCHSPRKWVPTKTDEPFFDLLGACAKRDFLLKHPEYYRNVSEPIKEEERP